MNSFHPPTRTALASALALFLLPAAQGFGQTTATTDPVGYASLSCLANSDTLVSIPFARPTTYAGAAASTTTTVTANPPGSTGTITFAGSPGFTANAYNTSLYFALIGPNITTLANTVGVTNGSTNVTGTGLSAIVANDELIVNGLAYNVSSVAADGTSVTLSRAYTGTTNSAATAQYDHSPREGSYFTVTDNSTNTLTVNLNGDSLSAVAAGTTVSLIPYWTLGTAFPAANAYDATNNPTGSYVVSTGTAPRSIKTQILLPDLNGVGTNLATSGSYFNYNSHWCLVGSDGTVSSDNVTLLPSTYFTVRNPAVTTTFTPSGGVAMNRLVVPLATQAATAQDNAVALPRPVAVSLNDLGLITSGAFTTSTGTGPRAIKDTLLVYDNMATGTNKSSLAGYYYYNNGWRLVGSDGLTDYGSSVTIPYGTGFTIRKALVTGGITSFWQNTRTY